MKLRKSEYFRIFSDSINNQLNENYDATVVNRHKREYQELSGNKNQRNFILKGKYILL